MVYTLSPFMFFRKFQMMTDVCKKSINYACIFHAVVFKISKFEFKTRKQKMCFRQIKFYVGAGPNVWYFAPYLRSK